MNGMGVGGMCFGMESFLYGEVGLIANVCGYSGESQFL